MLLSVPAQARTQAGPPSCESAIARAAAALRLPDGLLQAVALVESGRPDPRSGAVEPWPWTINVLGDGYFFPNKASAIAAVQELQAAGVASIDVGCMQVNLMHHPHAFATLQQAFDPAANARYAALFLTELYTRSGSWTKAVGEYHSQTPGIAAPYQVKVLAHWRPPAGAVPIARSWTDVYRVPRSWEDLYFGDRARR
ncbi:MAG TPA: lytic transglycosylase domain-containing protein [Acetobacteraceae bacterium]|nr:lytic transglycosylase domain-containing protein [Acetobacteraceae bacterium]